MAVLHGDRDYPVPLRTAKQTAARTDGTLVTVAGAGHSWMLRDPEALPAIWKDLWLALSETNSMVVCGSSD